MLLTALAAPGCMLRDPGHATTADLAHYLNVAGASAYPDVHAPAIETETVSTPPRTILDASEAQYWDMTLEEAIQIAVAKSPVLRDLGGAILRSPALARTIHGPAIESSDPRQGMEAALSAFDANLSSSLFYEKNHRLLNNYFSSGGARLFDQDLVVSQNQLSKQGAAGTQMFLRANATYDENNAAGNQFPYAWETILETEVRQPLLQGAGAHFNRIAGPNATPGNYGGIMVARLNTDVSLTEFRAGLRDLVSNVENAYWDLYFAYRDLDARRTNRHHVLEVWQAVKVMRDTKQPGGEDEAVIRQQYFRLEEEVHNALTGRSLDATANFNGSSGGTFRGIGGVQVTERRLRLALGLTINDGRLIRPADEPSVAPVRYDWGEVVAESLTRREELHRQRLLIRRRELELVASRNFLLPRFDVFGRYRLRGLGANLFSGPQPFPPPYPPVPPDSDFNQGAFGNLFGDFQELQVGGELSFPIGFRRGHAAVRNAQVLLAREQAVLEEQERQILHDLSNAFADVYRAYDSCQKNFNCRLAAKEQVDRLRGRVARREAVPALQLVDAERRFADADIQYHRALAEYMVAMKNLQFEKGTLLEYNLVQLSEGPLDDRAARLAVKDRPGRSDPISDALSNPSFDRGGDPPGATGEGPAGTNAPNAVPSASPPRETPSGVPSTPAAGAGEDAGRGGRAPEGGSITPRPQPEGAPPVAQAAYISPGTRTPGAKPQEQDDATRPAVTAYSRPSAPPSDAWVPPRRSAPASSPGADTAWQPPPSGPRRLPAVPDEP